MDLSNATVNFAKPVAEAADVKLDLNEYLIKRPAATYFVKVKGSSLIGQGIYENDLLVVDRSLQVTHNSLVIAVLDNAFTVRKVNITPTRIYLNSLQHRHGSQDTLDDFEIWGTITYIIHKSY